MRRRLPSDPSHASQHASQGRGRAVRLQRLDQQRRVACLPAGSDPEEPPEHGLARPDALGGHARQEPQRVRLARRLDDGFDGCDADGADELPLQIRRTLVEPQT